MASPEPPLGGESGRPRSGKHLSDRFRSPAPSASSSRRGRSPARQPEPAPPRSDDDFKPHNHHSRHSHRSSSPRQRTSRTIDRPPRPRRRSPSVGSQRSDTYRPREPASAASDFKPRKPLSPSTTTRHPRGSSPSRKRRRTRSPSPAGRPADRHVERRRSRSPERSPPRSRKAERDVGRPYPRPSSRSRSPLPKYRDSKQTRRASPSPPSRPSNFYIPSKPRKRSPSPVYRESKPSRRHSPSPDRPPRSRNIHSRSTPPPIRSYKDSEIRDSDRRDRRPSRERPPPSRRSPSPDLRSRRRSISPGDRPRSPPPIRELPSSSYKDSSTRRSYHHRSPSPRERHLREARGPASRRGRSRSRSYSPRGGRSPRRGSREREMYPRQQNYYGQPSGRPPPIDTRFSTSPQQNYPPHRGGYSGGPSPHSSYHSSPNWSPQQSPYNAQYQSQGPPSQNYPPQGQFSPQNSYPHQNYGQPQQASQPAPHAGSPTRGGRGGFRGGLMNGAHGRPHQAGPSQAQSFPPAGQRPGGAHFSNLTWKPGKSSPIEHRKHAPAPQSDFGQIEKNLPVVEHRHQSAKSFDPEASCRGVELFPRSAYRQLYDRRPQLSQNSSLRSSERMLTDRIGVGTRGGIAPTNRLTNPPSSSTQATQPTPATSRDESAPEPIDEDADDNPFRPAKELRAKEHKVVESPVKSNKEMAEDRRTSQDSNSAAQAEPPRHVSESNLVDKKNMPPPETPASQSSQGPKISFNLKTSNTSKAPAAAPKPNVFQAKPPPPAPSSIERRSEPRSPIEPPRSRHDDRRPYERRSDPYMRDNYERDRGYYPRDGYERRDYRPDQRYNRYERDRPPPRDDRLEPPPRKAPPPKPDVKVLVVKETKKVWREYEGWKMFPKPSGYGPDGKVRWGKNKDLTRPPRPPPRSNCPPEHQMPPASVLPTDLNAPGPSVYPRKAGGASVVGTGTYGKVYKSINVYKHEQGHVALKKINLQAEKDGFPFTAVREIRTLIPIRDVRIPRLLECMVEKNEPYMIFEYVPFDLAGLINHTSFQLSAAHKKDLGKQMYEGIIWLHSQGILHRDIKAANILVDKTGGLKLTDFGLCKTFDIKKGAKQEHTNRVVTIWYRAPELLLGEICYGTEIDFWAAACVLVEILTGGVAVFPGPGSDLMQLDAMFWSLGKPTVEQWPRLKELPWWPLVMADDEVGGNLARSADKTKYKRRFEDRYAKKVSAAALDLLQRAFRWDPDARPDGPAVLAHPFFVSEDPPPARCAELALLDGDFHEWDHKMKRRAEREAREAKEKERAKAKRAAKRAAEDGPAAEPRDAKKPRVSGADDSKDEPDAPMDIDPPGAPADPVSAGENAEEVEKAEGEEGKPSA